MNLKGYYSARINQFVMSYQIVGPQQHMEGIHKKNFIKAYVADMFSPIFYLSYHILYCLLFFLSSFLVTVLL